MSPWKPFVQYKTSKGEPVKRGDATIIPQAKALVVRLPYVGFVWNRPVAILVEQNGVMQRFPITDVTRVVIVAMVGASLLVSFVVLVAGLIRRGQMSS